MVGLISYQIVKWLEQFIVTPVMENWKVKDKVRQALTINFY